MLRRAAQARRLWDSIAARPAGGLTSARRPRPLAVEALEERVVPARPLPYPVVAAGSGPGGPAVVTLTDAETGLKLHTITPYESAFTGGVEVAVGDLTGDGYPEVVVTPRAGGGPRVRVFDGKSGGQIPGPLGDFMAFAESFTGGVSAAVGDFTGDGRPDLAVAAGPGGGPHVRVFDGVTGVEAASFYAFEPGFTHRRRAAGGGEPVGRQARRTGRGGGSGRRAAGARTRRPDDDAGAGSARRLLRLRAGVHRRGVRRGGRRDRRRAGGPGGGGGRRRRAAGAGVRRGDRGGGAGLDGR